MVALPARPVRGGVPHPAYLSERAEVSRSRRTDQPGVLRHQYLLRAFRLPPGPCLRTQRPVARKRPQLLDQATVQSLSAAPVLPAAVDPGVAGPQPPGNRSRAGQGHPALRHLRHQRSARPHPPGTLPALDEQHRTVRQQHPADPPAAGLESLLPDLQRAVVVAVDADVLLPGVSLRRPAADAQPAQVEGAGAGLAGLPDPAGAGSGQRELRDPLDRPAAPQSVAAPAGIPWRHPGLRVVPRLPRPWHGAGTRPAGRAGGAGGGGLPGGRLPVHPGRQTLVLPAAQRPAATGPVAAGVPLRAARRPEERFRPPLVAAPGGRLAVAVRPACADVHPVLP